MNSTVYIFCFYLVIDYAFNYFFFFNDTATTEIYTLSLHDALPILCDCCPNIVAIKEASGDISQVAEIKALLKDRIDRSEEHTSELQSRQYLVCRLLLEKKKNTDRNIFDQDKTKNI